MSGCCHPGSEDALREAFRESHDRLWWATVLSGDGDEVNWSRRYKANLGKLASGDLVQVMEVARDLAERDASRGLSAGEKRMLARARRYCSRKADALRGAPLRYTDSRGASADALRTGRPARSAA
jgi:RNA polymerase-interacting CarD/CdnL/TRCF family regulator